jgi:hypothetical protein
VKMRIALEAPVTADFNVKLDEDKEIERHRKPWLAVLPLVFAAPRTGAPG